jgi:hypothetical protein
MDPYLEHPSVWPDVHNSLIVAIANALSPKLAPKHYARIEERTYDLTIDETSFVGRPDLAVLTSRPEQPQNILPLGDVDVLEVTIPIHDELTESYLEIRSTHNHIVVTVMELLSPANKLSAEGRTAYLRKRSRILASETHLVEIDLLRAGETMPLEKKVRSDYRILIAHEDRGRLFPFSLRKKIPPFNLPLLPGDPQPLVELNDILHDVYARARYDLSLDYNQPPAPPLNESDTAWAKDLIEKAKQEAP